MKFIKIVISSLLIIYGVFLGFCLIFAIFYNLWGEKDKWKK